MRTRVNDLYLEHLQSASVQYSDGKRRHEMQLRSNFLAPIALIISLALFLLMSVQLRADDEGPPVPDPQDLIELVRNTVLAVHEGNLSGSYQKLFDMGSPAFQAAYPQDNLQKKFARLKNHPVDLSAVRTLTPLTTGAPTLDRNGLLRILGFFEIKQVQLVYDLLYDYDRNGKRWRLIGISLNPRDIAPEPELIQPQ